MMLAQQISKQYFHYVRNSLVPLSWSGHQKFCEYNNKVRYLAGIFDQTQ